jgi:hypothetical protein
VAAAPATERLNRVLRLDSLPPGVVVAGAAVSHDDIELVAAGGNRYEDFADASEDAWHRVLGLLQKYSGL